MVTESPQGPSLPRWSEPSRNVAGNDRRLTADALASLSAAEVLHDLSNALAAIVTMSDVLIDEMGLGSLAVGHLRIMKTSASDGFESCQQLRRSLRETGRLDRAYAADDGRVPDSIHLSTLVGEMAAVLQSVAAAKARVQLTLREDLPEVRGRASQLRQVLMNLVINAAQAQVGSDGIIEVTTGWVTSGLLESERRHLMAGQLQPVPYVYLQVTDSGCGMPPEVKQRMFESHFTTKHSGRGDGLSAVRKIVQSHAGAVTVWDVPGGGTAVRLLLPAALPE